jgi:hypothetical protein
MISVSSNPVSTSINSNEFFLQFNDINRVSEFFKCKPVRHLKATEHNLAFILKRVAQFEFEISKESGESWVQFDSASSAFFKSAIRFEFLSNSKEILIHFETDTNVFMELFLENRISKLLKLISVNISEKLN